MKSSDYEKVFNNEALLKNAVEFTTSLRAFMAMVPPLDVLKKMNQVQLDYLAVHAFSEFVTATEDVLGWIEALRKWKPSEDFSLYHLLDKINVDPKLEKKLDTYLAGLEPEELRAILHLPTNSVLLGRSWPQTTIDALDKSLPKKIEGFRNVLEERSKNARSIVKGFNKTKHMLFAFPINRPSGRHILLPTEKLVSEKNDPKPLYSIDGVIIETTPEYIRGRSNVARVSQAVLCDTLLLVLNCLYENEYQPPAWMQVVFDEMND